MMQQIYEDLRIDQSRFHPVHNILQNDIDLLLSSSILNNNTHIVRPNDDEINLSENVCVCVCKCKVERAIAPTNRMFVYFYF